MVEGAILGRAFILRFLAGYSSIGKRVKIHFVCGVRESTQVSIVAVLDSCRGAIIVASAWDRQVRELAFGLEEWSSKLTN